jgi:hypothetical protein
MQAFIDFLLSIIKHVLPFWPVFPWEGGVRTTGFPFIGKMWYQEVKPGLRFKIPLLAEIWTVNVKRQTCMTVEQTVFTKDGVEVSAMAVITLVVSDPVAVFVEVHDYEGALQERALCFMAEYINTHNLNELSLKTMHQSCTPRVKREAERWGCTVEEFGVVTLAKTSVFRFMGGTPVVLPGVTV